MFRLYRGCSGRVDHQIHLIPARDKASHVLEAVALQVDASNPSFKTIMSQSAYNQNLLLTSNLTATFPVDSYYSKGGGGGGYLPQSPFTPGGSGQVSRKRCEFHAFSSQFISEIRAFGLTATSQHLPT
jgi:hypothetical protein